MPLSRRTLLTTVALAAATFTAATTTAPLAPPTTLAQTAAAEKMLAAAKLLYVSLANERSTQEILLLQCGASKRILLCQLALLTKKDDRIAACYDHIERVETISDSVARKNALIRLEFRARNVAPPDLFDSQHLADAAVAEAQWFLACEKAATTQSN